MDRRPIAASIRQTLFKFSHLFVYIFNNLLRDSNNYQRNWSVEAIFESKIIFFVNNE